MIDQPQAIAMADELDESHLRQPSGGPWVWDAQDGRRVDAVGQGHPAVAWQEHVDRPFRVARDPSQRPGQGIHDVPEATRLGPRLALSGDEHHAHDWDGTRSDAPPEPAPERQLLEPALPTRGLGDPC